MGRVVKTGTVQEPAVNVSLAPQITRAQNDTFHLGLIVYLICYRLSFLYHLICFSHIHPHPLSNIGEGLGNPSLSHGLRTVYPLCLIGDEILPMYPPRVWQLTRLSSNWRTSTVCSADHTASLLYLRKLQPAKAYAEPSLQARDF